MSPTRYSKSPAPQQTKALHAAAKSPPQGSKSPAHRPFHCPNKTCSVKGNRRVTTNHISHKPSTQEPASPPHSNQKPSAQQPALPSTNHGMTKPSTQQLVTRALPMTTNHISQPTVAPTKPCPVETRQPRSRPHTTKSLAPNKPCHDEALRLAARALPMPTNYVSQSPPHSRAARNPPHSSKGPAHDDSPCRPKALHAAATNLL